MTSQPPEMGPFGPMTPEVRKAMRLMHRASSADKVVLGCFLWTFGLAALTLLVGCLWAVLTH